VGAALLVPLAMQVVQAHFPAGTGWDATPLFLELRVRAGLSWQLAAWLFPLAFGAAAAIAFLAFECLLFALRFDRGDRAWTSMQWSLGGWRPVLAWLVAPCLFVALASFLYDPLAPVVFYLALVAPYLVPIFVPFFVTKVDYVSAGRPALASRPRWPGLVPCLLMLLVPVGAPLLAIALAYSQVPERYSAVYVPIALLLGIFLPLIAAIVWLRPGERAGAAARRALQPRVFLPSVVLIVRLELLQPMLLLVGVPLALFAGFVMPQLEAQLVRMGALGLEPYIHASRFTLSYWWAISMGWAALVQLCLGWFVIAGRGRLLFELGQVGRA
jgi:hypothetical protein